MYRSGGVGRRRAGHQECAQLARPRLGTPLAMRALTPTKKKRHTSFTHFCSPNQTHNRNPSALAARIVVQAFLGYTAGSPLLPSFPGIRSRPPSILFTLVYTQPRALFSYLLSDVDTTTCSLPVFKVRVRVRGGTKPSPRRSYTTPPIHSAIEEKPVDTLFKVPPCLPGPSSAEREERKSSSPARRTRHC